MSFRRNSNGGRRKTSNKKRKKKKPGGPVVKGGGRTIQAKKPPCGKIHWQRGQMGSQGKNMDQNGRCQTEKTHKRQTPDITAQKETPKSPHDTNREERRTRAEKLSKPTLRSEDPRKAKGRGRSRNNSKAGLNHTDKKQYD